MYKHVLVAVDLSDESEFLLKKAVGIAKRNDAQLSIYSCRCKTSRISILV